MEHQRLNPLQSLFTNFSNPLCSSQKTNLKKISHLPYLVRLSPRRLDRQFHRRFNFQQPEQIRRQCLPSRFLGSFSTPPSWRPRHHYRFRSRRQRSLASSFDRIAFSGRCYCLCLHSNHSSKQAPGSCHFDVSCRDY